MQSLTIPPAAEPSLSAAALNAVCGETLALPFDGAPVEPQALREAMTWFAQSPRSEEAFYVRLCAMPERLRTALERHFLTTDFWMLFRRICWHYGLRDRRKASPNDSGDEADSPMHF